MNSRFMTEEIKEEGQIRAEDLILDEDREVIVVRKPAGLAVETHRVTENDLESLLRTYLAMKPESTKQQSEQLFMVHRLDQPVEGVMVFAKTKAAAANLSKQVIDGRMMKIYHAKVEGEILPESGELIDDLVRDAKTNSSRVVSEAEAKRLNGRNKPKRAVLSYRKLAEDEVEVTLKTGRHHQIRVQLSHAGMPIQGDRKYGSTMGGQLCLASVSLSFEHPRTRKRMQYSIVPTFELGQMSK